MKKLVIFSVLLVSFLLIASEASAQAVKGEDVVVGKEAITIKLAKVEHNVALDDAVFAKK